MSDTKATPLELDDVAPRIGVLSFASTACAALGVVGAVAGFALHLGAAAIVYALVGGFLGWAAFHGLATVANLLVDIRYVVTKTYNKGME